MCIRDRRRAICDRCGEEILNEREVVVEGLTLCRYCACGGYYRDRDRLSPVEIDLLFAPAQQVFA